MPTLKVPGADLHYEVVGRGPMLLGIHGGDGSGEIWRKLSEELKDRFTVVFYDRKFFPVLRACQGGGGGILASRMILTPSQDEAFLKAT
jgi:hypothetical protein